MVLSVNLEQIVAVLHNATTFIAVFGPLPTGDSAAQHAALKRQYRHLVKFVHPDHVPVGDKKVAEQAFHRLRTLYAAAQVAIDTGTYGQSFAPDSAPRGPASTPSPLVVQSPLGLYALDATPRWVGDYSALYRAKSLPAEIPVIVKISGDPKLNGKLEWEARLLRRFGDPKATRELLNIGKFVPELLDTFLLPGHGGRQYRANVTRAVDGYLSLTDILRAFPSGLDPRDAAWICRRILGQTLAAAMVGVVHGAIVPDHVLVHPITHDPFQLGWVHALEDPVSNDSRFTSIIGRWRDYYPPEVLNKCTPDHRTDLYMAGKTMIAVLGGDVQHNTLPTTVPEQLARVVLPCVALSPSRRPSDGRVVLDDFTRVITDLWGRSYRPFNMPVGS